MPELPSQQCVCLPDLGTAELQFSLWYVSSGEQVSEGDRLAEVLIPGAIVEVAAPASGRMTALLARPGEALVIGQTLATLHPDAD